MNAWPAVPTTILLLTASNAFVPLVLLCMRQPLKLDCLWASLCMLGAVYFMFRR
jgi:uncharacterized protein (DUF486 family)